MDERYLEQADAISTMAIESGIARARAKVSKPVDFDGFCICGEEISPLRLSLGLYNCVPCQTANEKRHKLFRSP